MDDKSNQSGNVGSLAAKLHPLERAVLPALKSHQDLSAIISASGLQEIEVMRALQWLENKSVIILKTETKKVIVLEVNGKKYQQQGLPEKIFLQSLTKEFQTLSQIAQKTKLSPEEVNACIGILKRKVAIETAKLGDELAAKLGPQGEKILREGTLEEKFLSKTFPLPFDSIKDIDAFALEELKKRKNLLRLEEQKTVTVQLTDLGKKLVSMKIDTDVVNRLTPAMLKDGSWKSKQFRAYDVEINVPRVYGGKKHFVNQSIEYAKQVWIDMGFQEMAGNMVNTSFWNFDALFTAQDHPVRELQDTFFIGGEAEKGKIPPNLVPKVKEMHETGGQSGSLGWRYKWNEEEAKKNVLRTHTTVLTSQTLAKLSPKDLPAKFFALGKCFRNEAVDWCHHFEFNQTEGIVVDENANFRHLLGYLKEFFKKMGYPKARFRPAYFPYTEPSIEIDVWNEDHQKWVEMGGAGMLRPEVVIPLLGKDIPVLAWGPGFDRLILEYFQIKDIRDLYKNDVKQMREMKAWLK